MQKSLLRGVSLALFIFPILSFARPATDEAYTKLSLNFELQLNDSAIFGEKIDFHHGNVGFEQTDLIAEGNGIPIQVSRTFYSGSRYPFHAHLEFGDWAMNIPSIQTSIITNVAGESSGDWPKGKECTGIPYANSSIVQNGDAYQPYEYFDGVILLLGDGQKQSVVKNHSGVLEPNTTTYPWVTKENWKFSCISRTNGTAEGFVGYSPNGLKLTFDQPRLGNPRAIRKAHSTISKMTTSLMVSKIEDRFGNYIQYNYDTNNQLTSITANDGRNVTFTYSGLTIATMTYNGRTWSYTYDEGILYNGLGTLVAVTDPENQVWSYDLQKYGVFNPYHSDPQASGGCGFKLDISADYKYETMDDIVASVTAPNGVQATYTFAPRIHGRGNCSGIVNLAT